MRASVFLELAASREDFNDLANWRVVEGLAERGGASCDFAKRTLRVPLGIAETDRVVRIHELLHLRLSPPFGEDPVHHGVSARALECAEELRINWLLHRLAFNAELLRDGSEKTSGQRLGAAEMWSEVVYFYLAVLGTGGEKEFLAGVRRSQPNWPKALRALRKEVVALMERTPFASATATPLDPSTSGFVQLTVPMARIADRVAGAQAPNDDESWRKLRRSLAPGGRRAPSGHFAELVIDTSLEYVDINGRVGSPTQRYDVVGTRVADPSREWRDLQQRVFRRRGHRPGGVVLVDQSGSMDIADGELDALLEAVPGVIVLGYSHRPGDMTGHPNGWVLAHAHQRVRHAPTGNVGNGVDGPALRWALEYCPVPQRLVWVTDGQVTDSNDHPNDALTEECAQLVRQHRIHLVRGLLEAAVVLRTSTRPSGNYLEFGRIGRKLGAIRDVS